MSGEAEPRRSVRATKGQHTKPFDQLDQPLDAPKRKQGKKGSGKKSPTTPADEEKTEEPEDEVIRCVCGATEQDEDSGEPWIACDTCGAWQHNVCMGMSVFTEDVPNNYYCERCEPSMHEKLLVGIEKGEKPWEARRAAYEAEAEKKKKKGRKGGRGGRRVSDQKEREKEGTPSATAKAKTQTPPASVKGKTPPAPEQPKKEKKEPAKQIGKRKSRDDSDGVDSTESTPAQKLQKVSESRAVVPGYTPPEDLATSLADLPDQRQGPVKVLLKSLTAALNNAIKKGNYVLPEDRTAEAKAEQHAIQIERAVFDSHANSKEYASQCRTLAFNLKNNEDLASNLFSEKMSPTALATMTSSDLASKELQREMAEMKARVEKQSILISQEGPRMRRTHKGEEMVENDYDMSAGENPSFAPAARETSTAAAQDGKGSEEMEASSRRGSKPPLTVDTQQSPRQSEFDIGKVFSSVKSPTLQQREIRRPSGGTFGPASGPGVDADVDRLLQEDNESEPYSPTEDNDPDVVWRGHVVMNSLADIPATIKYVGGANLAAERVVPWTTLIPPRLSVAGRIDQQKAIEYLCSLRYNQFTDVVVTSISPSSEASRAEFDAVYKYFVSKGRYGVVGDKGVANVRDTYLVPVVPGEGNFPEFMLNLATNLIPAKRAEPMLLAVFVYRDDSRLQRAQASPSTAASAAGAVPTPSISPAVGQAPFPAAVAGLPRPPSTPTTPAHPAAQAQAQAQAYATPAPGQSAVVSDEDKQKAQVLGQQLASEILGPLKSAPTVQFLLPMAHQMTRSEWEIIRELLGADEKAREDLQHLSMLLDKHQGKAAAPAPGPGVANGQAV
ncbi:related to CTI6 Cyc8-Tup1 Interacting protein [Cephalotrichum gorgonifer]|uniref:Transcription factor BYE1 n=1 Tax=Cephalotrichum gorgonifer TaxID=2041049 RepID=A0AAE8N470_9PEZI|nr:related to CTI6 Cyc8-Tup1 Interacting protein [Cephalotrichum gorgonifer]